MKIHSLSVDDFGVVLQFSIDEKNQYAWVAEIFQSLVSNNLSIELSLFDDEVEEMATDVLIAAKQPMIGAVLILGYSSRNGQGQIQISVKGNDKGKKKAIVGNN